jgi:hypothetical protein
VPSSEPRLPRTEPSPALHDTRTFNKGDIIGTHVAHTPPRKDRQSNPGATTGRVEKHHGSMSAPEGDMR